MKRKLKVWCSLLLAVFGLLSTSARATIGLWSTPAELATQPMSGPAWTQVLARADEDTSNPNVGNQDDNTNVRVLAAAIVYARSGNVAYKNKVKTALQSVVAQGDPGDRTLAWARETGAYALAADLIDYQSDAGNAAFRTWLRNMAEVYNDGSQGTLLQMFKKRPNNWGTHAFGALVSIYAYLEDTARLNEVRNYWIAGVVGPNPGFIYDSNITWHVDPNNLRIYNPKDAVKSGVNIDGVVPDDMRRGGSFANPPNYTDYAWETQQGPIMGARVLGRIGMSVWETGDMAIYRGVYRLQVGWAAAYGSTWKASGDDAWMLPFIDSAYGTNLTSTSTDPRLWDHGKNAGFGYVALADGAAPAQVASPSFNPAPGTFSSAQSVTITTATSGATIRYTTNGTNPTPTTGTVYSSAVSISSTTTLKAIAYKSGMIDSSVTSGTYTINVAQVAPPVFNPAGGSYSTAQSVTITSATSGASIRYTTNGTTPTSTTGTVYSAPVSITATTTLKAIAYKSGMTDSTVTTGAYTINGGGSPVKFTIPGTAVTASAHDGNVPANTVDGNLATRWSAQGDGQWIRYDLGASGTVSYVKIAWHSGNTRSALFDVQVSNDGTAWTNVLTNISSSGTTTALEVHDFADVSPARYVRIVGHGNTANDWNSITETEVWGIADASGGTVSAPSFNPAAGTYSSAQSVTITSATSGASIRYTTDGSTPTATTGTVYSSPVSIAATTTLKAIAYKSGMANSNVTTGTYTISGGGGTFNLSATADSFVEGGSATTNFNSTTYLRVKNASGDSNDRWIYIKFDLSSVTGTVQSATLKLKLKALTNGGPAAAHVYSVTTDSWTETGLTWSNKPATGTVQASNTNLTTVNTVYNFTITSFVAAQNTGDRVVTIAIKDDTQVAKAADFYRREDGAADGPILTVVTQ